MKIKKTWLSIKIEITPQEIKDMYEYVHPNTEIFPSFIRFLRRLFERL